MDSALESPAITIDILSLSTEVSNYCRVVSAIVFIPLGINIIDLG